MGKIGEGIQRVPKEFHLLAGTSVALFLATQTIEPIFPLYITERGATTFEVGLILSILSLTAIVAKVPLGILADRAGKWPVVPVALVGQSLSLLLYSVVSSAWGFYPIRIFHALILAGFAPTAIAITSDLAPKGKRGDMIGRFLTSYGAATMLGPFLCSFLLNYLDYVQILRLTATMPVLGLAAFLLFKQRDSHINSSQRSPNDRRTITLRSLISVASSRNVMVLSYLRLTFSFTNAFLITLFALYASESLLMSSSLIAVLFGVKGVTNMVFRFPSGKLSDRIGHKTPLVLSYLLCTLTYLVISESGDFYVLSVVMALYGFAHAMRAVTEWSLLGDSVTPDISGLATSYLSTMFNIGEALGAVVSGALSLILPTPSIFRLATLVVLPGAFVPLFIRRDGK